MQYTTLGNTGIKTSVIGLGCWAIGGWMWGGADENDAIRTVHAAVDHGINLLDTAPIYGYGHSEEVLGKALAGRSREGILIATKCGLSWEKADWPAGKGEFHFYATQDGPGTGAATDYRVYKYLRPESIRKELEESLRRLRTDYVDLYQTHWQDGTSIISETMNTLLELKKEGKIRAIGVSNINCQQLDEYFACGNVDAMQEQFSLLDRRIETDGLLDYARRKGMSLLPYSPLCRGLLTGKLNPAQKFAESDGRCHNRRFSPENILHINRKLADLGDLCREYGLSVGQLIIAWTFHKYEKTHVICGARTPEQILENAQAGDVVLKAEDISRIEIAMAEG